MSTSSCMWIKIYKKELPAWIKRNQDLSKFVETSGSLTFYRRGNSLGKLLSPQNGHISNVLFGNGPKILEQETKIHEEKRTEKPLSGNRTLIYSSHIPYPGQENLTSARWDFKTAVGANGVCLPFFPFSNGSICWNTMSLFSPLYVGQVSGK